MPDKTSPTDDLDQLKRAAIALKKAHARITALEQARSEPIAIVGIGCRLPGNANSPQAFWQLLRAGVSGMIQTPAERWEAQAFQASSPDEPGKMQSTRGGFINDIDQFDPHFFGISPREANAMDPQQRLTLEVVWEALEDAGIIPASLAGSATGVFMGIGINDYGRIQIPAQAADPTLIDNYFLQGNSFCITPNRVSYVLDLQGPSMAIDTACSASLVAIHTACASLRNGDSVLALVGGTNLMLAPDNSIGLGKFLAPDGLCKAFDSRANGYARGEGCIILVLKRLSDASAAHDRIYAVIRGSAINQDGFSSGLTVPNGVAQEHMLRTALKNAGLQPAEIDYVEAHGTGTALGDPIEANALGSVFASGHTAGQELLIGSVKTNIGHLEAGAGIAGLLKVVLALYYHEIPPSLNFIQPNPMIDFPGLRLKVVTQLTPWPQRDRHPHAGVSSFGFGGANAHVILEAAPVTAAPLDSLQAEKSATLMPPELHLFTFSAKTPQALTEYAGRFAEFLQANPALDLNNVCYTVNQRRSQFQHRLAVVAQDGPGLAEILAALHTGKTAANVVRGLVRRSQPKVAFLFTGQGSQYVGMGSALYQTQPVFRAVIERCAAVFQQETGESLLALLYPAETTTPVSHGADAKLSINHTTYTQPALFAIEYALAELWRSWGVEPAVVLGHSIGEYVAACVAGVMSLEDGMRLITARGRLMGALPAGGVMAAVFAPLERVQPELGDPLVSIGGLNAPDRIILSGAAAPVQKILDRFEAQGIQTRKLVVSHAFHSPLMEPILDEFERVAATCTFNAPHIPLISNITGHPFAPGEIPNAAYWRKHVRAAVNFSAGMAALHALGIQLFLETGPNPVLLGLGARCLPDGAGTWLPSLRQGQNDEMQLYKSLAALYCQGLDIQWAAVETRPVQLVSLPTYPFQHERYWFKTPATPPTRALPAQADRPLLGNRLRSPLIHAAIFETLIHPHTLGFLWDHQAYATGIFPATGFIEMAFSASEALDPGHRYQLEDLTIQNALLLPAEGGVTLQVVLTTDPEGRKGLSFYSSRADASDLNSSDWTLHATATLTPAAAPSDDTPSLLEAQAACPVSLIPDKFYAALHQVGMEYGPAFQNIRRLWRGAGWALAHVQLPETLPITGYSIHPALLDACIQTLGATLPDALEVFLPLTFEKISLYTEPGRDLWSFVHLAPGETPETFNAELTLYSAEQQLVGRITGLRLKRAGRAALQHLVRRNSSRALFADWLYRMAWRTQPLPPIAMPATLPTHWLILADEAVGSELARLIPDAALATPGAALLETGAGRWSFDPTRPDDFKLLLKTFTPGGVISLSGDLQTSLHLLQAVSEVPAPPQVWLATFGAQPVLGGIAGADDVNISQASLSGFVRSVQREVPELSLRCIDLDPAALPKHNVQTLWHEIQAQDREDEVAYRNDERFVSRLERMPVNVSEPQYLRLEISERGTLDNLVLRPMERRLLAAGEVEIDVRATGVNFRDVLNVLNMYPGDAGLLGHECSGIVIAVGGAETGFQPGDAVLALAPASFATFAVARHEFVVRKPTGMSFEQAGTIPITFLTADYALNTLGKLQPGERVLIHAAAGGVGLAAVQLAKLAGAEIYATAGSPEKRALLQTMGVQHVMNSRSLDFADEIMRETHGAGVHMVLNSLADDFITRSLDVLQPGGRFLEIGKRGIWTHAQVTALGKNIAYHIIYLGAVMEQDSAMIGDLFRRLMAQFETNVLQPLPYRAFPLTQAADAFRYMAQARHVGKLVLTQPPAIPSDPEIRSDASYLITGGHGGIGLTIAGQLVEAGARHLILVGRHIPSEAAQAEIAAIQANSSEPVSISSYQADLASFEEVQRLLLLIQKDYPPLAGIIHAAGVLQDGVLARQDWSRFAKVLAPKLDAALHLHHLTAHLSLDFFVMFSAGAGWLGSAGQTGYAAANTAVDALAYYRRARGLPAVSIAWGAWAQVGMAARMNVADQERLSRQGFGTIAPDEGAQIFENSLEKRRRGCGAADRLVEFLKRTRQNAATLQRTGAPVLANRHRCFIRQRSGSRFCWAAKCSPPEQTQTTAPGPFE